MSDKTTAALAAEQADTEATTTQEAELLPAATLDDKIPHPVSRE